MIKNILSKAGIKNNLLENLKLSSVEMVNWSQEMRKK